MDAKKAAKSAVSADKLKVNEKKWTKQLMDAGWTALPSVIIERQRALGLDVIDLNIIVHLSSYWWTADNKPRPAKTTIAAALNVTPRTVQRHIARLEKAGFIRREERRRSDQSSYPNIYHFDGLIKAATPYAKEKLEKLAARAAEKTVMAAKRGKPKLKLVATEEDQDA
jgi:predicted transcriptional regulator